MGLSAGFCQWILALGARMLACGPKARNNGGRPFCGFCTPAYLASGRLCLLNRIATLLIVLLATLPPLGAQSGSEHKAAREQFLEAERRGDLERYLAAAAVVGRHKTPAKGLVLVLDKLSGFAEAVTQEGLDAMAATVADLLAARLEKPLKRWHTRYRREPTSPKARDAKAKILARDRKRLEKIAKTLQRWFARLVLMEARARKEGDSVVFAALRDVDARVVRRALHLLQGRQELRIIEEILASYNHHKGESGSEWQRTFLKMKTLCERACGEELPGVADYGSWLSSHRDLENPFSKKTARKRPDRRARTGLFGLRVTGKAIVFVLDVSGSMNEVDYFKTRRPARGRTRTTAELENEELKNTRLARSQRELKAVIRRLRKGTSFNVITYASPSQVSTWQREVVPTTPEAMESAAEYIDAFKAGGVTATDIALDVAFEDPGVDTIYLISDGLPTHLGTPSGEVPSDTDGLTQLILDGVRERNLLRDLRVFALGFPQVEKGYAFLAELARQNDGRFIKIGGDDSSP
jgi:hypothetical protein